MSQGDIVEKAISLLENELVQHETTRDSGNLIEKNARSRWKQSSDRLLAEDPDFKQIIETLGQDGDTIDDYIIQKWETGLK